MDLNSMDAKLNEFEGTERVIPIGMKEMNDRIDALENKNPVFFDFSSLGNVGNSDLELKIDKEIIKDTIILGSFHWFNGGNDYGVTIVDKIGNNWEIALNPSPHGYFEVKLYVKNNKLWLKTKDTLTSGNDYILKNRIVII